MKKNFIPPHAIQSLVDGHQDRKAELLAPNKTPVTAIESVQLNSPITYFATTSPLMIAGGTPGPGTVN